MMTSLSNLPKITKGQRDALKMIAEGRGSFHSSVGDRLERDKLAYPLSGLLNFLARCNCRTADGWVLTELGAACIGYEIARAA